MIFREEKFCEVVTDVSSVTCKSCHNLEKIDKSRTLFVRHCLPCLPPHIGMAVLLIDPPIHVFVLPDQTSLSISQVHLRRCRRPAELPDSARS